MYDPLTDPDAAAWLAMDDGEKIAAVSEYHRRARIKLPNRNLHSALHVVIENQVAMGDATAARATLVRLVEEGLDRHDAIHAIASILATELHRSMTEKKDVDMDSYTNRLQQLTAQEWLEGADDE